MISKTRHALHSSAKAAQSHVRNPYVSTKYWSHTLQAPLKSWSRIIIIVRAAKYWSLQQIHCWIRTRTWIRKGSPLSMSRLQAEEKVKGRYLQRKMHPVQVPQQ